MAQRLEQSQAAVQTQQLSSMQVAVAKLVELPVTELVTRVRDEMVDNAALEEKDPDNFDVDKATEADDAQRDDDLEAGEGDEAGVRDEENSFEEQADYGKIGRAHV